MRAESDERSFRIFPAYFASTATKTLGKVCPQTSGSKKSSWKSIRKEGEEVAVGLKGLCQNLVRGVGEEAVASGGVMLGQKKEHERHLSVRTFNLKKEITVADLDIKSSEKAETRNPKRGTRHSLRCPFRNTSSNRQKKKRHKKGLRPGNKAKKSETFHVRSGAWTEGVVNTVGEVKGEGEPVQ